MGVITTENIGGGRDASALVEELRRIECTDTRDCYDTIQESTYFIFSTPNTNNNQHCDC